MQPGDECRHGWPSSPGFRLIIWRIDGICVILRIIWSARSPSGAPAITSLLHLFSITDNNHDNNINQHSTPMAEKEAEAREAAGRGLNFVEQIVADDLAAGKNGGRLNTRFPPEPNGYLHIGHAKAICMDFGVAEKFGGTCNLRFDDTNPVKEDVEYVDAIREDIHGSVLMGRQGVLCERLLPQLWDLAVRLIKEGKAYVDDQTSEEIAAQKGTPTEPGVESPYRNRSVEENLDLFERMNKGEFEEGARVLRAKIDMASPNMHFRDPIMYRIIKTPTTAPATHGRSILCMTSPTARATTSRG